MKPKTIAVVAAHPDDEILGCGGTLAAHVEAGEEVHILILTEGVASRIGVRVAEDQAKLQKAAAAASREVGSQSLELAKLPDNRMDSLDLLDVIKKVESFFQRVKPDVVYTHHLGDLNIDHGITHKAVVTAARPLPGKVSPTLLFFETPSSTEWQTQASGGGFNPNWFVDITHTVAKKRKALMAYALEMREFPHSRSVQAIEALWRWRGACIGVEAAEAFMLGRHVEKLVIRKK
jgi:LmbE family N-acetylglucosaminyl deacetylase